MSKIKFVLPMLAFVLAIGMSFAFTNATEENYYANGFIETSQGVWTPITVNCENGNNTCRVYFTSDPSRIYDVYPVENPDKDEVEPLKSSAAEPIEL